MHCYNDGRLPYSYALNISLESTGLCRLKFLVSEYYFGADYISGVKGDYLCLLKASKLYVTIIYSRTKFFCNTPAFL